MAQCPVCRSFQIVIVVSPLPKVSSGASARPRGNACCSQCGTRWVQRGSEQRAIHGSELGHLRHVRRGRLLG